MVLTAMVLIGSSTAMAARFALAGLPIAFIPLARFGIAGVLLLPVVLRSPSLSRLMRQDFPRLALAAALCVPVNQMFFLNGAQRAPTSHVGIIYAACPLVVLLLAAWMKIERLTARRLIAVIASVAGVAVLAIGNLGVPGGSGTRVFEGDLLLLGAVISWGGYMTVTKPLVERHGSLATLAGTFLIGSLLQVAVILATGLESIRLSHVPAASWWSLAYLCLVATTFGLACQNFALKRLEASHVATVGNLSPLLTVVWGVLLLGEPLSPALVLGGGLAIVGMAIASRAPFASPVSERPELALATQGEA
jgi:drug/metabolite transporter (DMT)-like permease